MCRAWIFAFARIAVFVAAISFSSSLAERAAAQVPAWSAFAGPNYGALPPETSVVMHGSPADNRSAAPRGPLARLVRNSDRSGGLPPFALADQNGTIQRYVEPVPGVDLAPHVGQVVVVRHDTGRTLLASQLDLPLQPLRPMTGPAKSSPGSIAELDRSVQPAQYADDDDATVELLEDDEKLPDGNNATPSQPSMPMSDMMMHSDDSYPTFPGQSMAPDMGIGPPGYGLMHGDPSQMEWLPGDGAGEPCPHCGGYHGPSAYGSSRPFRYGAMESAKLTAAIELNFLRLHMMEEAVGKLSEKYEFSPRFILGVKGLGPLDGRIRYWTYGRDTKILGDDVDENSIRFEFDVLDIEGTHTFCGKQSEVTLAAGVRLAAIDVTDDDDEESGSDLLGLTLAADGRTRLAALEAGRLSWVYGGRLSILGGDWGTDEEDDGILDEERIRDDNVVVHELYAGLELSRCYRGYNVHARLAFEMQNWHSDVLAESALDTETVGIVGPGLRIGADF